MPDRAELAKRGNYPGGKNAGGFWQWIVHLLPPHRLYCEPFLGSGAVLRHKSPALVTIGAELDRDVARYWKTVSFPGFDFRPGCGLRLLETEARTWDADAVIYCDPPYPHPTRSKRRLYAHEWDHTHHARFLAAIVELSARCLVSTYPNDDYYALVQHHGWTKLTRQAQTRGGPRQEWLLLNYSPLDQAPPLPRITGSGFRERERIKRKARRWAEHFARLPAHERAAILARLLHHEQTRATV